MREPPADLTDAEVLAAVRTHWSDEVDRVEHLPVGFGAHHWQALAGFRPVLFVTWDTFGTRRSPATLEAAYAAAAELAFALDFVVAGLPAHDLTWTVPVAGGALSVTPWVHGVVEPDDDPAGVVRLLARLHAAHPPAGLPRWTPLEVADLPDRLARALAAEWTSGPQAPTAQAALRTHLGDVGRWVAEHRRLVALTGQRPWVVTHGEPHAGNRVPTLVRTLLVDWESVRLAPRERDLLALAGAGHGDLLDADPEMLALFDLEWRLDEIDQYAAWFAAPHTGTADDLVALDGLLGELSRP